MLVTCLRCFQVLFLVGLENWRFLSFEEIFWKGGPFELATCFQKKLLRCFFSPGASQYGAGSKPKVGTFFVRVPYHLFKRLPFKGHRGGVLTPISPISPKRRKI